MRVNISTERRMATANMFGLMEVIMKEVGKTIKLTDMYTI